MVALSEIKRSNLELKTEPAASVSVFVGATAGIGRSTLHQLAQNAEAPTVYIVGRSASAFASELAGLKSLNPLGTFIFIEAQVSLIKEVDRVCKKIREKEPRVDLLWVSTGALSLNGRQDTSEGLALNLALTYYSRMRFIFNLLPQLLKSPHARVVSILAAGLEGKIVTEDLDLKTHYSFQQTAVQGATFNALVLEELATQNPSISFVYGYPGFVDTNLIVKLLGGASGWQSYLTTILRWTAYPILRLFATGAEEAGERGLYEAASGRFVVGAEGAENETKNFFRVNEKQEKAKTVEILETYKREGWPKRLLEHTSAVYEKIEA